MNVLLIKGTPKSAEASVSLQMAQAYVETYQANHPVAEVAVLDLYADEVPLLDEDVFSGWGKLAAQQPLTAVESHKVQRLSNLVDQFLAVDTVVFALPMWNFGYPPMVKAYLDAIAVAGKTFRYTAEGPVGLAGNKQVVVCEARGGIYSSGPAQAMEHTSSYLTTFLSFIGITDVQLILAEGLAMDATQLPARRQEAVERARQAATPQAVAA
ncbi:NAD(P)H-dependent oxidoreductase [Hymenobacter sp. YC55]|uniref:FMN-dependent NADH-azoreductase n=1 Tax=Hymenobacter sp. YC55 TaxID=3034019 RepID=UPI0023F954C6|nr:NAD(P)H-dependent oxidoreductase [Hymenobacter sp. YC55]MDF7815788.1 NAD(P)H-dependent oxidoreductase [Hymenobacter sp. YC55]